CKRLFDRFPQHAKVSHLTPWAAFEFAVQVKFRIRMAQNGLPVGLDAVVPKVAEQVDHDDWPEKLRRSKRQTAHGTQLLFKLARQTSIKCIVAGIVRPWSELIHEQLIFSCQKKFYRDQADYIQVACDFFGDSQRVLLDRRIDPSRNDGIIKNMMAMDILGDRKSANVAFGIPGTDDR